MKDLAEKAIDKSLNQARRYNEGKFKPSLVPVELIEGAAKVMTYGEAKYTIKDEDGNVISSGKDNWRSGLAWTSVIDSLERHLLAFKKGEDYDVSGHLHMEHIACNVGFLLNYYKTHPELDDRIKY